MTDTNKQMPVVRVILKPTGLYSKLRSLITGNQPAVTGTDLRIAPQMIEVYNEITNTGWFVPTETIDVIMIENFKEAEKRAKEFYAQMQKLTMENIMGTMTNGDEDEKEYEKDYI